MTSATERGVGKGSFEKTKGKRRVGAKLALAVAAVGFLLLDSNSNPIYINDEAAKILNYGDAEGDRGSLRKSVLANAQPVLSDGVECLTKIRSGRRRYICRFFCVSPAKARDSERLVAILIQRDAARSNLSFISNRFSLTHRESETVQLLMEGLTSKEIAARMGISPSTVKVFLKLAMAKMGVTTRSGIVGKVMRAS